MSGGVFFLAGLILGAMAAWGSLSFSYPNLAFRLENIFQLRDVELSTFGLFVHKIGGIALLVASVVLPIQHGNFWLIIPSLVGAVLPLVYFYRTRRTLIVQGFDGRIETP